MEQEGCKRYLSGEKLDRNRWTTIDSVLKKCFPWNWKKLFLFHFWSVFFPPFFFIFDELRLFLFPSPFIGFIRAGHFGVQKNSIWLTAAGTRTQKWSGQRDERVDLYCTESSAWLSIDSNKREQPAPLISVQDESVESYSRDSRYWKHRTQKEQHSKNCFQFKKRRQIVCKISVKFSIANFTKKEKRNIGIFQETSTKAIPTQKKKKRRGKIDRSFLNRLTATKTRRYRHNAFSSRYKASVASIAAAVELDFEPVPGISIEAASGTSFTSRSFKGQYNAGSYLCASESRLSFSRSSAIHFSRSIAGDCDQILVSNRTFDPLITGLERTIFRMKW